MSATDIIEQSLQDGKGMDIKILFVAHQSGGLFERMIIATANSPRHVAALAERARVALKTAGLPPGHIETSAEKSWILVDAGEVIAHIMVAEMREIYDLESLWGFEETHS